MKPLLLHHNANPLPLTKMPEFLPGFFLRISRLRISFRVLEKIRSGQLGTLSSGGHLQCINPHNKEKAAIKP